MKGIKKEEIDRFVSLTSGKSLSTRDLDLLARGYFNGNDDFREQLNNGDINWVLSHLKEKDKAGATGDCTGETGGGACKRANFNCSFYPMFFHASSHTKNNPACPLKIK